VIMFAPLGFMGFLRFIREKWFRKRPDMAITEDAA